MSLLPLRELKREKVANLLLAFDEKGKRPRLSRKLRATGPLAHLSNALSLILER